MPYSSDVHAAGDGDGLGAGDVDGEDGVGLEDALGDAVLAEGEGAHEEVARPLVDARVLRCRQLDGGTGGESRGER